MTVQPNRPAYSWWQKARCTGIFRYHFILLGKTLAWLLAILLGSQLLGMVVSYLATGFNFSYGGVEVDFAAAMVLSLVLAILAAGRSTRFLLRFGTSRFSVWLCSLCSLLLAMLAFLLLSLPVSLLASYLTLWLSQAKPGAFVLAWYSQGTVLQGMEALNASLQATLASLPQQMLWLMEWTCIFYLLGCCLRRSRGWTLAVVIGVPMALMLVMVIPAVRQVVNTVQSADQSAMMRLGLQWMQWLSQAAEFVVKQWQWVQLGIAAVSLPLSYLCMRRTKQP